MFFRALRFTRFKSPSQTKYKAQVVALIDDYLVMNPSSTIKQGVVYAINYMKDQGVNLSFYQVRNWVTKS